MKRRVFFVVFLSTILLTACGDKENHNVKKETQNDIMAEQLESSAVSNQLEESTTLEKITEKIESGKSKEDYLGEIGVSIPGERIVLCYDYAGIMQYKVYEFTENEYKLVYYDFYADAEDYQSHADYMEPSSFYERDFCDSSVNLIKYHDKESHNTSGGDGYQAIMLSARLQIENSENHNISLIE